MAYQPPFPPSSTPPYETSTLLPPSHPSPYAELPRTDRALQYPPSYYGPIQTPLPILPANLADFRDGKYAWRYSWVDHDIRFGALGFAVACFDRGFAHRTMLPFQREYEGVRNEGREEGDGAGLTFPRGDTQVGLWRGRSTFGGLSASLEFRMRSSMG